jgi:hypothetical protein
MSNWTLFSNHGHVLVCLARDSEARLRDVAMNVGITERAVQKIVRDLQDGGMISVTKNGRRNRYRIHKNEPLRHQLEADCTVNDLVKVVNKGITHSVSRTTGEKPGKTLSEEQPPVSDRETSLPAKAAEPERSRAASVRPETTKGEPVKDKPAKPAATENKDRQQRSLF